jgi:hypothetical protein
MRRAKPGGRLERLPHLSLAAGLKDVAVKRDLCGLFQRPENGNRGCRESVFSDKVCP